MNVLAPVKAASVEVAQQSGPFRIQSHLSMLYLETDYRFFQELKDGGDADYAGIPRMVHDWYEQIWPGMTAMRGHRVEILAAHRIRERIREA
jgi:hypothetical protein